MSRIYRFECIEDDTDTGGVSTRTLVEFETDSDMWSGYNGPMWKFFEFLKGCGFIFDMNSVIGVYNEKKGTFVGSVENE